MRDIDDRTLTLSQRKKVLEKYDYVCVYCFVSADTVDHIIPWSYEHNNNEDNLVACCWFCNLIASNKMFKSFQDKRDYIITKKYNWIKENPIPLWILTEFNKLGRNIKRLIKDSIILLDNQEQRERVRRVFLDEGFRVIMGQEEIAMIKENKLKNYYKRKYLKRKKRKTFK